MTGYVYTSGGWESVRPPYVDTTGSDVAAPTEVTDGYVYTSGGWKAWFGQDLGSMSTLSEGSISHTSLNMTYGAVSGATHYEIWRKTGTGSYVLYNTMTGLTYTNTGGVSEMTTYTYKVRAKAFVGAEWIYTTDYSNEISGNTGRPAETDSGTSAWIYKSPSNRGQWRNDVGWGYVGSDMRQGYYSVPYDGDGYRGISDFGGAYVVRDKVRSALGGGTTGTNRQTYGTCSAAECYLYKEYGVGSGGSISIGFYTSDEGVGGAKPLTSGTKVTRASTSSGAGAWYNIGTAHGQRLGDGGERSVMIYQGATSSTYASFNGGDTGRIRLKWTWNYTVQSYVAAAWL